MWELSPAQKVTWMWCNCSGTDNLLWPSSAGISSSTRAEGLSSSIGLPRLGHRIGKKFLQTQAQGSSYPRKIAPYQSGEDVPHQIHCFLNPESSVGKAEERFRITCMNKAISIFTLSAGKNLVAHEYITQLKIQNFIIFLFRLFSLIFRWKYAHSDGEV